MARQCPFACRAGSSGYASPVIHGAYTRGKTASLPPSEYSPVAVSEVLTGLTGSTEANRARLRRLASTENGNRVLLASQSVNPADPASLLRAGFRVPQCCYTSPTVYLL